MKRQKPKTFKTICAALLTATLAATGIAAKAQTLTGGGCPGSTITITGHQPTEIVWRLNGVNISTVTATISGVGTTAAGRADATSGTGPAELKLPYGMCLDDSGNLYVADRNNYRVQKWAPGATSGTTVAGGHGYGAAANQFRSMSSICIDPAGNIYVADEDADRVMKWAPGDTVGTMVAGTGVPGTGNDQLDYPEGICLDAAGNLYVADGSNERVQKWAPGATSGITVAGGNGEGSGADQLFGPFGIRLDDSGNMYIGDQANNRIQKWAPGATSGTTVAGNGVGGSGPSELNAPYNTVINGRYLYVADLLNARVQRWTFGDAAGITVVGNGFGSAPDQIIRAWDVCMDHDGNLYVADGFNHRIQKYASSITTTLTATSAGDYTAIVTTASGTFTTNVLTVGGISFTPGTNPIVAVGATSATLGYTGSASTYSIVWSSTAITRGFTNVTGASLPPSSISITVPAAAPAGVYAGTLTATSSCGSTSGLPISVTTVATVPLSPITATSTFVCIGNTTAMWNATPGGVWSIAPASVATISPTGVVSGIAVGTATVSYTAGLSSVTKVVTVYPLPAVITGTASVCQGQTTALTDATTGGVWSSTITSIATIGTNGVVSAVAPGTVPMNYTLVAPAGCKRTIAVTVNALPANITGPVKVCTGLSISLSNATSGGAWSGSNAFGTVDGSGNVTGVAAGAVVVTYTSAAGCRKTLSVAVNQSPANISGNLTVCTGKVTFLSDATTPATSWTSSTPAVATITASGAVTGVASGTTSITYTLANGCKTTAIVTVNATPTVTAILGASSVSRGGAGITLSDATAGGIWTSSNTGILNVGSTTGNVTAIVSAGSATINYIVTNGFGCTAFASKVISASPAPHSMGGATTTVGATVDLADEAVAGEWTSSDHSIATVDENGIVTAVAAGTVTITHTSSDNNGEISVNSTQVVVSALPMQANLLPNPNKGTFTVQGSLGTSKDTEVTIEISNMLGQSIYSGKILATGGVISEQIRLNNTIAGGMYLLNLRSGDQSKTLHFVID